MGDDSLINLAFDMSEPPVAAYESISDFFGTMPDAPYKCDGIKLFESVAVEPKIVDLRMPAGSCEHRRQISGCWICNPCKICPNMVWNNLERPHPRTKAHLTSSIHRKSLRRRINAGKSITGDDDYVPNINILLPKNKNKSGAWCAHNKRRRQCRFCNPCVICFDAATNYAPANSWDHRKSTVHLTNVEKRLGLK